MLEYPDSVDIRYAVASTYEDQGQVKLALRELKDVLKSRPDDPAAMNAYGYTLADHNEDLKRARTLIERAYARLRRMRRSSTAWAGCCIAKVTPDEALRI